MTASTAVAAWPIRPALDDADGLSKMAPIEDKDGEEDGKRPRSMDVADMMKQLARTQTPIAPGNGATAAIVQFATGSTLLPQNLADMVTNLALLARVSLKSTAFFIEVILETAKYGTGMGLGLTRRALISAVGTARAIHALKSGEQWDAQNVGRSPTYGVKDLVRKDQSSAFLSVLDKYTALGVYLIHHSFTLAELFAQSGFYLAESSIKAGLSAADESVRVLDGIFGSNETSRALSSFIGLLKRELGGNDPFVTQAGGGIRALGSLTKAITTFAVLQNATYRRTAKTQKTRVLYDCIVLGETKMKSWRAQLVGPGNFVKSALQQHQQQQQKLEMPPAFPGNIPSRTSSALRNDGSLSNRREERKRRSMGSIRSAFSPSSMARPRSIFMGGEDDLDLAEMGRSYDSSEQRLPRNTSGLEEPMVLLDELDYLVGAAEEDDVQSSNGHASPNGTVVAAAELRDDELTEDLREILHQSDQQELEEGLVLGQLRQEAGPSGTRRPRDVKRIFRRKGRGRDGGAIYEITTETTEVIEETTTTTTTTTTDNRRPQQSRKDSKSLRFPNPFNAFGSSERNERSLPAPPIPSPVNDQNTGRESFGDDDWMEVERSMKNSTISPSVEQAEFSSIPEMPNGKPAEMSVATVSRKQTLERPDESRQRVQEVVRTMTRKLIQRKRIVQQVHIQDEEVEESELDSPTSSPKTSIKRKGLDSPKTISDAGTATPPMPTTATMQGRNGQDIGSGLNRALHRAKSSLKGGNEGVTKSRSDLHPNDRYAAVNSVKMPLQPIHPKTPVKETKKDDKHSRKKPQIDKDLPAPPSPMPAVTSLAPGGGHNASHETPSMRRKRRPRAPSIGSIRSFASRTHTHTQSTTTTTTDGAEEGAEGAPGAFPRQHLVKNLRRFSRHSSAAYGQNVMRVLGIGDGQYLFADTRERSANIFSYAHHVGIPPNNVLLSSYCEGAGTPFHSEKMAPIVNYISRDDEAQAIVLTCRGTLGLSDMLTDLTCDYVDINVPGGKPHHHYQVHSGMLASAQRLSTKGSIVLETLRTALVDAPNYGLVITGHSLGAGVGILLALLLSTPSDIFQQAVLDHPEAHSIRHPRITTPFVTSLDSILPPGRPIHVYGYGCPATSSADLSRYCKGLCTVVVHGHDMVPYLSLGWVRDMKAVASSLSDERESIMAQEIVGRVVGLYQNRKRQNRQAALEQGRPMLEEDDDEDMMQRPTELPLHERNLAFDVQELADGRTRNRATEDGYRDPSVSEDPKRSSKGNSTKEEWRSSGQHRHGGGDEDADEEREIADWLWSLIKTMRASMDSDKLYPPGQVYHLEAQQVFVTANMSMSDDVRNSHSSRGTTQSEAQMSQKQAEAARVIMRLVEDVTTKFSEPVFARSMLRDHIPTNYELVTQLLWEAVIPKREQEQDRQTRQANMEQELDK